MEALVGIAFGAGLAWLATAYGQRRAEQTEHLKWPRERRYEVWTEALAFYVTLWHYRHITPKEEQLQQLMRMRETLARMTLLGPGTVVVAASRLTDALMEFDTGKSVDELEAIDKAVSDANDDFLTATLPYLRPVRRRGLKRVVS